MFKIGDPVIENTYQCKGTIIAIEVEQGYTFYRVHYPEHLTGENYCWNNKHEIALDIQKIRKQKIKELNNAL